MEFLITAASTWTAAGRGTDVLLDLLQRRQDAFRSEPPWPCDGLDRTTCGVIDDLERDTPARTLLRTVVTEACSAAGVDPATTGLVVGTTSGDISGPWERWHRAAHAGLDAGPEPGRDTPTRLVARQLGLAGPQATVSVACASGTVAFALATGWLADGLAQAVVVAGLDALSLFIHAGFHGLGALSAGPARPFSAERDGLTLGEGAAALVLEPARGRSGVFVRGVGMAADAVHISAPHREGRGAATAMRAALDEAGVEPGAVDMVSLHGTGTDFNDAMEAHALRAVLGERPVAFHGIKHAVGHTMGAAGAVEAAVVAAALQAGVQPPPPAELDPQLGLSPIAEPTPARVALSTSSAFGGANASVVLALQGGSPLRAPVAVRTSEPVRVSLPAGPADWKIEWPDAPDRSMRMNRYVRLGLLAVHRLFEALGGAPDPETGIVLASPEGCRLVDLRYHARLLDRGAAQASRLDFVYTIPGGPAAEAGILFDLRGPPLALVGPMEQALDEARRLVRWGRARRLVALGLSAPSSEQPATAIAHLVEAAPGGDE